MSTPILVVEDLVVAYGQVEAVRGVSFHAEAGALVTLVGANGAGKTSILNAVAGLVRPRSGRVLYDGKDVTRQPAHKLVAAGLVQVPEGRLILGTLTVEENLQLGGWQQRATQAASIKEMYERFPLLAQRCALPAGALSGGEQQMLAIARALMLDPKLLLLDEPSLGLAPIVIREIFDIVSAINHESGTTILVVEQNANLALRSAETAYVLDVGRVALSGKSSELAQHESVRKSYLGD